MAASPPPHPVTWLLLLRPTPLYGWLSSAPPRYMVGCPPPHPLIWLLVLRPTSLYGCGTYDSAYCCHTLLIMMLLFSVIQNVGIHNHTE